MNCVRFDNREVYPSKIVCVGRNYAAHARELENEVPDQAVLFIKPNSAISDDIVFSVDELTHYEAELTFLVVDGEFAGVGFGLDLTKRRVQDELKSRGLPWERAKAFDKSAVFSKFVGFDGDVARLRLELYINGELVQSGGCRSMLNKPEDLLKDIKSVFSLNDADLIMTGTPEGVGAINRGDRFTGKVFDEGTLLVQAAWVVK
jgi:2-keto-4-pentenoate hydratase/2-oxohepta-3-ene-1,7-dioic acid hydratase in catechol pathway